MLLVAGRRRVRLEGKGETQPCARGAGQLFHCKRARSSSCPRLRRMPEGAEEKTVFLGGRRTVGPRMPA